MKKAHIRIFVQWREETADEFAGRIEGEVNDLIESHGLQEIPDISFTASTIGRQTVNIMFSTAVKHNVKPQFPKDRVEKGKKAKIPIKAGYSKSESDCDHPNEYIQEHQGGQVEICGRCGKTWG